MTGQSMHSASEEILVACALRAVRIYAAEHPRPTQVNAIQAGEMLSLSPQTMRKMIKDGRLPVNKCGLIPIVEVDRCLAVRPTA